MVHARDIAEKLTDLDKAKHEASKTTQAVARRKAVLRVRLHGHWRENTNALDNDESGLSFEPNSHRRMNTLLFRITNCRFIWLNCKRRSSACLAVFSTTRNAELHSSGVSQCNSSLRLVSSMPDGLHNFADWNLSRIGAAAPVTLLGSQQLLAFLTHLPFLFVLSAPQQAQMQPPSNHILTRPCSTTTRL